MGHATVLDAFNAAANFNNQMLGHLTREEMEKNNLQLKNVAAEKATDFQDYLRDNPYDPTGFAAGPEKYREKYLADMQKAVDGKNAYYLAKNNSPYYKRQFEQMNIQLKENARAVSLAKEDEWRLEQSGVEYSNRRTQISNNKNFDIPTRLEMMTNALEEYAGTVGMTPADRAKQQVSIYNEVFDSQLSIDINGIATVQQAYGLIDKNLDDFEAAVNEREGKEGVLDEWLANKNERIAEAKQAAKLAIQKRNYIQGEELDNEYRRIAHDAMNTGDISLITKAFELYRRGVKLRDAAINSSEYNPDDHPKIENWFPTFSGLMGGGSGSGSRGDNVKKLLADARYLLGTEGAQHKGGKTYERAAQEFEDFFVTVTEAYGYSRAEADLEFGRTAKIDAFMGDLQDFVKEIDPQFNTVVMGGITNAVKHIAENNRLNNDQSEMLQRQIAREIWNTVADLGLGHLTHEEWIEKAKGIAARAVGGEIALMNIKDSETVKNMSDKKHIKMIEEAKNNPDMIGQYNGDVSYIGNENNFNLFKEFIAQDIAIVIDVPEESATASGWANEDGRQDDITAIPLITVKGAGDKDGTYKQDIVEAEGKNGKVEKKIVTLKYDEKTKDWKQVSDKSGGQVLSERLQKEEEALESIRLQRAANGWADKFLELPESARQSFFNSNQTEIISALNHKDIQLLYDALRERGIDPYTVNPLLAEQGRR